MQISFDVENNNYAVMEWLYSKYPNTYHHYSVDRRVSECATLYDLVTKWFETEQDIALSLDTGRIGSVELCNDTVAMLDQMCEWSNDRRLNNEGVNSVLLYNKVCARYFKEFAKVYS